MEGAAKPSTSSGSGVTGGASGAAGTAAAVSMEERLADLCKNKLGLDESTTRQAMQLFKETKNILKSSMSSLGGGSPEEIERFWFACVLYCVSRLSKAGRAKEDGSVSLCQILRASKLNIVDFFKEMPQFCIKVAHFLTGLYGSDWEKRLELKELQANVVHLSLLSRYYKRAYKELFLSNDAKSSDSSSESNNQEASDYHRFGWLLFLVLRIQTFSRLKDLVTSTNGLVSVLAVLIIHVPARLRNFNIKDSSYFGKKSDRGVNLIASLCEKYHTSEDELSKALEKTNTLIMDILKKEPCSAASECQQDNLSFIDPEGLTIFKDLLQGDSVKSSLLTLEKEYENAINTKGELDERMFANDEDSLIGSGSLSGGAINLPGTKRKYDVMVSPAKSITSPNKDEVRSPKRACTERRNVLVDSYSFRSPVKDIIKSKLPPPLQSAFASPTRPNPAAGGETCAETGIGVFFSKIAKLAAIRIRSLCERLQLSQQVLERVYSLVQQTLSQQTSIFFNRHIDQIILCSIYGVAKISQLDLSFKEIIFGYRKQPQCKPQVFRSVYVHWPPRSRNGKTGEDHVDIITFYNEVFIPAVKPLLVEVGPGASPKKKEEEKGSADGPFPESPRLDPFPNLPDMSPKKVSATHNVYVSPLRSSKMDTLLSPSSKSYYACVGESTYAFQSPSKDLKAINNRLNSGKKVNGRLNFDVVSDLVVASSLSSDQNAKPAAMEVVPVRTPMKCEPSDS
nr:unnamed protein product [Digitaria exilis]